ALDGSAGDVFLDEHYAIAGGHDVLLEGRVEDVRHAGESVDDRVVGDPVVHHRGGPAIGPRVTEPGGERDRGRDEQHALLELGGRVELRRQIRHDEHTAAGHDRTAGRVVRA